MQKVAYWDDQGEKRGEEKKKIQGGECEGGQEGGDEMIILPTKSGEQILG